jgi:small-conductance mechanosensitive channel
VKTEELLPEEWRHIQNLSVIPAAMVVYIFIGYFIYLVHIGQPIQPSFYVWYFLLVFLLAMPATLFLSQEILYARKTHRPFTSGLKRFLGKISLAAIGAVLFAAVLEIDSLALSSLIGESELIIVTGIIWFVVWALLVLHFRRRFDKLYKGYK